MARTQSTTEQVRTRPMRNGMNFKSKIKRALDHGKNFESYFKIGVSDDYILMRRDFPMQDIPPSDFSRLLTEMFRRNKEARNGK